MTSVLLLGFLLGMRHALDGDHLAAVAALAGTKDHKPRMIRMGLSWALGHSITLLGLGSIILLTGAVISPSLAAALELLVGFLLVALGAGVIHRVIKQRVHFHAHDHGDGAHVHAHSHAASNEQESGHEHAHAPFLSRRALAVGVVHGLAGSAALVLLTVATIDSVWVGMGYLAIFAAGTIAGMGLLSCIIALPLRLLAGRLTAYYTAVLVLVGLWSIGLGGVVIYENSAIVAQAL